MMYISLRWYHDNLCAVRNMQWNTQTNTHGDTHRGKQHNIYTQHTCTHNKYTLHYTTILSRSSVVAVSQMIQKDPYVSGQAAPPVNVYSPIICTIKSLYWLVYTRQRSNATGKPHNNLCAYVIYYVYSLFLLLSLCDRHRQMDQTVK